MTRYVRAVLMFSYTTLVLGSVLVSASSSFADDPIRVSSTGKVGINNDSPDEKLHVKGGKIKVQGSTLYSLLEENDLKFSRTDGASSITQATGGTLNFYVGSSLLAQLTGTEGNYYGDVYLRNIGAGPGLGSGGTCTVYANSSTGQLFCGNSSSMRFKENIHTYERGLKEVMELKPVSFSWKKSERDLNPGRFPEGKLSGLIAEQVDKVMPELVTYDDEHRPSGVKYSELTPLLIKAIQDQQKQIDDLRRQIALISK